MNISCIQTVRCCNPGNPLEKTPFFPPLRLDFWKEHDKLLIDFDTQNKLIEEKNTLNPTAAAAQPSLNSIISKHLSKS